MPITKSSNVIVESAPQDDDQFKRTGVMRGDQYAFCDPKDRLKQIKLSPAAVASDVAVTLKVGAHQSSVSPFVGPCPEHAAGNSSTALTVDFANGPNQAITLTGNCTFTFANPIAGDTYVLRLTQDGTGSRTVTWPAAVKWPAATAPVLTTAAAGVDVVSLYYNGTSYYGAFALGYA
jgi:hypothetical protein